MKLRHVFNAIVVVFLLALTVLPGAPAPTASAASAPAESASSVTKPAIPLGGEPEIPTGCGVIKLPGAPSDGGISVDVSTSSISFPSSASHLHVEFWTPGNSEFETLLPGWKAGVWSFTPNVAGGIKFWPYAGCTDQQIKDQIDAHIRRRQADPSVRNGGFVEWQNTMFIPAGAPVSSPPAPAPQPPVSGTCQVTSQYLFDPTGNTLSMSGASHIQVEYHVGDNPEVETMLPASATATGNWSFTPNVAAGGRVWFLSGCSDQQVLDRINTRVGIRRELGIPNSGFVDWRNTFFQPNAALGQPGITPLPPAPPPSAPIICDPIKNTKVFNRPQIGDIAEVYRVNGPSVVKTFFWDDDRFPNGVVALLNSTMWAVMAGPRIVETWSLPNPSCPYRLLEDAHSEVINRQGAARYSDVRDLVLGRMNVYP